ncbi:MAG: fructose-6-phosphate aldolase [Clostridia bacterium]|nr:fructose-6-phosphate aldolase [Clostridia bacterium]
MKFFIDTANVNDIKAACDMGVIYGVTTNPSIIAKEGKKFEDAIREISGIIGPDRVIFAEVIDMKAEGMIKEGQELVKLHNNVVVKIPMCPEGLKAVAGLKKLGIPTCVTLCFSSCQALLAVNAGASYVAPFVGRVDDIGGDGVGLITEIADIFAVQGIETKIVVASTRSPLHIAGIARAGADIATIPYKVIAQMANHPLTTNGLAQFMKDWENVPKD